MFGRKKNDDSAVANTLSGEARPNVLSGDESEAVNADPFGDAADRNRQGEDRGGGNPELQSRSLYGPNGEAVAELIEALDEMSHDQIEAVAASWTAIRPADRQIAEMMARRLRVDRRLDAPLRAAEKRIGDWLATREPADDREAALYGQAADAARDAASALILDHELNDVDFATLYGPWSDVMDEEEGVDDEEPDGEEAEAAAVEDEAGDEAHADGREDEGEAAAERDFGPNGELVAALLAQLEDLSAEQLRSLSGAWDSADQDALKRAQAALEGAMEADPDSRDEVARAQARVAEWAERGSIATAYGTGDKNVQLRKHAAPAVADAVAALAMADALSEADAATLYGPWVDAVGEPELPSFEDEEPS
jgi:hypothetical protein